MESSMEKRELTCIGCPMGCQITVEMDGKEVKDIQGYTCKRGKIYAQKEVTNPTRIVTSTVRVTGNPEVPVISVKTAQDIPKAEIFDCVRALKNVTAVSPVKIGDVILHDVCGTGVDVIATKSACVHRFHLFGTQSPHRFVGNQTHSFFILIIRKRHLRQRCGS